MRIETQGQSIENAMSSSSMNTKCNTQKQPNVVGLNAQNDEQVKIDIVKVNRVLDSMNELSGINIKHLKFIYHEGLKEYFVQLVNSKTDEVIKEIPPKKLLDAFYEMQKLVGMIVDEKK